MERLRNGWRTSAVAGMLRTPNQLRQAYGLGWALVGELQKQLARAIDAEATEVAARAVPGQHAIAPAQVAPAAEHGRN